MEKVTITSNFNGTLEVISQQMNFKHTFPKKGAKFAIDREILEQLMYEQGVEYMLNTGMIYIEDLKVKQELGLEPEDATEPVNIIVLSDNDKKRYLTVLPDKEFEEKIKILGREELNNLADYAIKNEILSSYSKTEAIRKLTGKDIISAIRLNRQDKED